MACAPEQPDREERILYEIVVDAYGEAERAMGWYYYLQGILQAPFTAQCWVKRSSSPLKVGQAVQVIGLAEEDECMSEIFVLVERGRSRLAVPLAQLECKVADEQTRQAVADWHYWLARGYEY
jgi:hypothetical protein